MGYQSEAELENRLIKKLETQGYEKVLINDYAELENNFRKQLNKFNKKAKKKAEDASKKGLVIRLINGDELTKLMIKHNIGVQIKNKIEIKKLDEDFFAED